MVPSDDPKSAHLRDAREAAREATRVFLGIWIATAALVWLGRVVPIDGFSQATIGGLYLYVALRMAQRERGGAMRFGLALNGIFTDVPEENAGSVSKARRLRGFTRSAAAEFAFACGVALIVLPIFAVGFRLFVGSGDLRAIRAPDDLLSFSLAQWLAVGIPEEALFRGYFQTRWADVWPRKHRVLGAEISVPALVVSSLMFAAVHVTELDVSRLVVFFPGLLFGWVRGKRGGIGAAAVLHALCNIASEMLFRSWVAST